MNTPIERQASLRRLNTLGVDSIALELASVTHEHQLPSVTSTPLPIVLLGGGSNIVLNRFVNSRVVRIAIRGMFFEQLDDGSVRVRAGAGENWNELVRATVGRGIAGLENLVLIPGLVGGAPYQNIGAYGRELAEVVEWVRVFDLQERTFRTVPQAECDFSYRDSLFKSRHKGKYVITSVQFRLGKCALEASYRDVRESMERWPTHETSSRTIAETVSRVRRYKLPDYRVHGNIGSFFKNPTLSCQEYDSLRGKLNIVGFQYGEKVRVPAARLIEACGWKGRTVGNVNVWQRQPLVLVNRGHATGSEFLSVARRIEDDVHGRFQVALEIEPVVVGEDS